MAKAVPFFRPICMAFRRECEDRNSMQGSPLKRAEEEGDERGIPAVKRPA